ITYGMQEADKSFGRCPNGTGSFTQIKIPTFKESNVFCVTGINEKTYLPFNLYPNPSTGIVFYNSLNSDAHSIELYSIAGELVQQIELEKGKGSLNLSTQKPGLYFYRIVNPLQIPIKSGKIILTNAN
ncbi:MAG: T9SS type A sorting domain-containing protein, partial [Bacteroidia bacterium]|nr:T9SS type A sorting domain-containing protein [Bacteroidia bacterium]